MYEDVARWPEMVAHHNEMKLLVGDYPNAKADIIEELEMMWGDIEEGENVQHCIDRCRTSVQIIVRNHQHEEEQ